METATDLLQRARELDDYWSPRVVGRVNDQYVKVAKLRGDLTWHDHAEDELFLVLEGKLRIELDGRDTVDLETGQFFVIPAGVRHNPVADDDCYIALIEAVTTSHTGDVRTARTKSIADQLAG